MINITSRFKDERLFNILMLLFHAILLRLNGLMAKLRIAKMGTSCTIDRGLFIEGSKKIEIGKRFTAGKYLRIQAICAHRTYKYLPTIIIKDNVNINDYVHIACNRYIEIGNNVLIASKVIITDHQHGDYSEKNLNNIKMPPIERPLVGSSVIIEDDVWVGENSIIMPGVRIGKGSIIGANSVVNKSCEKYSILAGIPAKLIKRFDGNC